MTEGPTIRCACCGASVAPQAPEYFIEIESFRLMAERNKTLPRRGSLEYHREMDKLRAEIEGAYFRNPELYDRGHIWCPACGNRLLSQDDEKDDFSCNPGL